MTARAADTDRMNDVRRAGLALICAKLVLVPLVFDPAALVVFSHPKALLSHVLGLVLFVILVGLALGRDPAVRARSGTHAFVAAFALAHLAATALALDQVVAVFGAHDRALGLATVLDNVVLFASVVALVRTPAAIVAVGTCLFATPLLVLGYEFVQLAGLDPLPWASGFTRVRPFATLGNAANLAQYLGTLAGAAAALALFADVDRRARFVLAAIAALFVAGAYLTGTRAVILGVGAAAVTLMAWAALVARSPGLRRLVVAGGAVGSALAIALLLATPLGRAATAVLVSAPALTMDRAAVGEGSVGGRLVIYDVAVRLVSDRPVLGAGPDNFAAAFPRYRPEGSLAALGTNAPQTSTHSWVAHVATSAGLVGLAALIAAMVTAALQALRTSGTARPIAIAGTTALASFLGTGLVSTNDPGTEWLLWLALAAMAGATARIAAASSAREPPIPRGRRHRRREGRSPRAPLALAIVVLAIAASAFQWRALDAAHAAEDGRQARGRGARDVAARASERATELDPLRAEHWNGLGLAYGSLPGRLADAERAFRRADELAPYNVVYATNLARAQLGAGDQASRARALDTVRRAIAADPNNGDPYYTLALIHASGSRWAEAVEASERGVALQPVPSDRFAHEVAGRAYLELGRPADAERWLRSGAVRVGGREAFDTYVLLARALATQGKIAEALAALDQVFLLDPNYAPAVQLRSQIQGGR